MGEVDTSKLAFEPDHTGQGLVLHLLPIQMYPRTPVYIYSDPCKWEKWTQANLLLTKPHRSGVGFAFATKLDVSIYPSLYIQ